MATRDIRDALAALSDQMYVEQQRKVVRQAQSTMGSAEQKQMLGNKIREAYEELLEALLEKSATVEMIESDHHMKVASIRRHEKLEAMTMHEKRSRDYENIRTDASKKGSNKSRSKRSSSVDLPWRRSSSRRAEIITRNNVRSEEDLSNLVSEEERSAIRKRLSSLTRTTSRLDTKIAAIAHQFGLRQVNEIAASYPQLSLDSVQQQVHSQVLHAQSQVSLPPISLSRRRIAEADMGQLTSPRLMKTDSYIAPHLFEEGEPEDSPPSLAQSLTTLRESSLSFGDQKPLGLVYRSARASQGPAMKEMQLKSVDMEQNAMQVRGPGSLYLSRASTRSEERSGEGLLTSAGQTLKDDEEDFEEGVWRAVEKVRMFENLESWIEDTIRRHLQGDDLTNPRVIFSTDGAEGARGDAHTEELRTSRTKSALSATKRQASSHAVAAEGSDDSVFSPLVAKLQSKLKDSRRLRSNVEGIRLQDRKETEEQATFARKKTGQEVQQVYLLSELGKTSPQHAKSSQVISDRRKEFETLKSKASATESFRNNVEQGGGLTVGEGMEEGPETEPPESRDNSPRDDASSAVPVKKLSANDLEAFFGHIRHKNKADIEEVLAQGFDVNARDASGKSALMVAAQNGNKKLAKRFLRMGADPNQADRQGNTALHFAFSVGYKELADYLISKGADDTLTNVAGKTCYDGLKT